jgi:hypothetical protein
MPDEVLQVFDGIILLGYLCSGRQSPTRTEHGYQVSPGYPIATPSVFREAPIEGLST